MIVKLNKGIVAKPTKIGRNRFEETTVLPEKAESSLRSAQVASAITDRIQSIHRRGMGELPATMDRAALIRQKKKKNRNQKANKFTQRNLVIGNGL